LIFQFAIVAAFLLTAYLFVTLGVYFAGLIRPQRPGKTKETSYECGEMPQGPGRVQFNLRFYLIAFVFVIFDVEIVFIYPIATIFKAMIAEGQGLLAFTEIFLFVFILMAGFIYAWSQGALKWQSGPLITQDIKGDPS